MIYFGENSLQNAIREFLGHHHRTVSIGGWTTVSLRLKDETAEVINRICCCERLGGMSRQFDNNAACVE